MPGLLGGCFASWVCRLLGLHFYIGGVDEVSRRGCGGFVENRKRPLKLFGSFNGPFSLYFVVCLLFGVGGFLLSHNLPVAVPSARAGLASGFGMGPGVSLLL